VIVREYVPAGVFEIVDTLSVDVLVAGFGLNVAEAPDGRPLTENVTEPVNPFRGVTVDV